MSDLTSLSYQNIVTMTIICATFASVLLQVKIIRSEESLLWNSENKSVNLIAPSYLPESKKENRRLVVVVKG